MTLTDTPRTRGLVERAKALILRPHTEWEAIEREPDTIRGLYARYVLILAAIPPLCGVIGWIVGSLFRSGHGGIVGVVVAAAVDYAMTLGMIYVIGLAIETAAPYFGGAKDRIQAMKVAAYFPTALWLAGVFAVVPVLAPLQVLGLYSLFILWQGLPRLMKIPEDKAVVFTLVVILVALIAIMIVRTVAGMITTSML
jgi:hypothetical protein